MTEIIVDSEGVERTPEEQAVLDEQTMAIDMARFARQERNHLLAQTDYLALNDQVMSAEMTAYRQALRDVTSQEGFPDAITWPTKPEA